MSRKYDLLFKTAAGLIDELKEAKDEKLLVKYARLNFDSKR
jgi:hypothetical protein